MNSGIVGAVAQFKLQSSDLKKSYPQMFCDLVRVGTLRACNAIMQGLIVDQIVVFGLLTSYEMEVGVLVKYYIDFITDESVFLIGDEVNFVTGFMAMYNG